MPPSEPTRLTGAPRNGLLGRGLEAEGSAVSICPAALGPLHILNLVLTIIDTTSDLGSSTFFLVRVGARECAEMTTCRAGHSRLAVPWSPKRTQCLINPLSQHGLVFNPCAKFGSAVSSTLVCKNEPQGTAGSQPPAQSVFAALATSEAMEQPLGERGNSTHSRYCSNTLSLQSLASTAAAITAGLKKNNWVCH